MDYAPLIEKRRTRLAELETQIADPALFNDRARAEELMREHRRAQELMRDWDELQSVLRQLEENRELAAGEDEELAALAQEDLAELEPRVEQLEERIQYSLLPRDATEDRDALVEIRAGTGGDEASLFAGTCWACTSAMRTPAAGSSRFWMPARAMWAASRKSPRACPGKRCSAT